MEKQSPLLERQPGKSGDFTAFISHAKPDQKRAQEIAASLERRGLKCWIAPRDVRPGQSYGDEIIRGIERSRCFVLILSKASNDSPFVAREVERAVSKRKPIFPIRVEEVVLSSALELFISSTQWIDAFPDGDAEIARLANVLAGDESGESVPTVGAAPAAARALSRMAAARTLGHRRAVRRAHRGISLELLWEKSGERAGKHTFVVDSRARSSAASRAPTEARADPCAHGHTTTASSAAISPATAEARAKCPAGSA